MQTLLSLALVAHIASGFTALAAGLTALVARKGLRTHRMAGAIFFYSMVGVALSALLIAGVKSNEFLLTIAIFSFYQNYAGWRAIRNKSLQPSAMDWLMVGLAGLNALYMVVSGQVVLMVFGGLGGWQVAGTLRLYGQLRGGRPVAPTLWLIRHLSMMTGAFIATVTAFLVVNVRQFEPAWAIWLLPTVALTPLIFWWIRKVKSRPLPVKSLTTMVLVLGFGAANAQVYVEGGNTRHRFAQLTLGADARTFFSRGSTAFRLNSDGTTTAFSLHPQTEARILVGGTHFWGHAWFYLAFPVASVGKSGFVTGSEMGGRMYPWRLEKGKLRPYLGLAMLPTAYRQGDGPSLARIKAPVIGGITYQSGRHLFDLGAGFNYANGEAYPLSPSVTANMRTHPWWLSLGYSWQLETTLSAEKDWISGKTRLRTDSLGKAGVLNGFTLAAGPSSNFFLGHSTHNEAVAPYAGHHMGSVFPEFGLGYYWHRPDVQVNLAWRAAKSSIGAYGFSQTAARKALTLEAYRFLFDYHGFVPFVGPALSQEWLAVEEVHPTTGAASGQFTGVRPGLTFGWDIRPNRLQQFYLRTNLRWFPWLKTDMNTGKAVDFSQLEFNFIELVVFPGRF